MTTHIICTHEQADFDAVASLLGVWLMDREAIPLLPRRLNRNVRAFVTLYGEALPFQRLADWVRSPVDRITVVDTQSPPSIKGMSEETAVHLIDHHPEGDRIDQEWSWHIEEVGATATLLVEELQELGLSPDMVQSTLLLLGIYEDTGSLSYAGTTPRDIRASAWLVESKADLNLVADFLNHPLSNGQRALYDRLLENAETHDFQGLKVVIATGEAGDLVEEISTLAHKLRDVYDPDGLFVLVEMDDSVQLVARSTTDALDVGNVAESFGGGGHDRAAAALIRGPAIEKVRTELLDRLAEMIEPAVTVGEIMSRDPQLLDPDVKVGEAAERMQRFGHEGYPVVENGNVLGLLTRRAVDRAMSHGMQDDPILRIMQAGEVKVSVNDSIHYLQKMMIEHGWGQVPVTDALNEKIIGIVTRTDLLAALGSLHEGEPIPSLAEDLERALPAARLRLLKCVAAEAEARKDALYIVGGFVRDLILGAPSVDYDLVVEGDAIGLAQALAKKYGGRVSSHRRFGTAKWGIAADDEGLHKRLELDDKNLDQLPETLDFVTARTEFYPHPTSLPSVRSGSIKLDLHRRDFTINTLALRLDGAHYGQLLDHWGGGRDLRDGKIRVLHSLSFMDDPTRMLRAVRLEQRLGFDIEQRTRELLEDALPLLDRVSGDRIRSEIDLIFKEQHVLATMDRLDDLGLFVAIHPDLPWNEEIKNRFERVLGFEPQPQWNLSDLPDRAYLFYAVWLVSLVIERTEHVAERLSFPGSLRKDVIAVSQLMHSINELGAGAEPSKFVNLFEAHPERVLIATWLSLGEGHPVRAAIEAYLMTWRFITPTIDGDALRERGLKPGPQYTHILSALRDAWLDGRIQSQEEESNLLTSMLEEINKDG
ncbi:MAG: CBS domain-containing protein [Anaerolineales bacterium]